MTIHRRSALKGLAATGTGIFGAPAILRAGMGPIRIGFLTVKTGPLASGGIQMEEGLTLYLLDGVSRDRGPLAEKPAPHRVFLLLRLTKIR
jgi:hypothetical protein